MTGATLSRWDWRNWPVLVKLIAVLLVPTMVALVVGVLRVVDQAGAVPGYNRISDITEVQENLSSLISAVQRERDLATAFVADGRTGEPEPLDQQFRAVASRAAEVRAAADQASDLEATGYSLVLDELRGLRPLRESVLSGVGPVEVVVAEYNAAIDPLIELNAALVRQLDDVAVANDAAATHALLASREQVSRQHAIVLSALFPNRIEPAQIDAIRDSSIRLGTHQEEFEAALNPAERAAYVARVAGDAELARQRILQLVLNRGQEDTALDIRREDWSERSAVATSEIAGVENELRQRVDQTALALREQAQATAAWNAVILAFALVLGVFIGIMVARSMLRPLGTLKRTALDVADRRLPAAMARIRDGDVPDDDIEPVAVSSREEIGQVARAFDEVHRQAIRLAGEQAQLRAHVNDIFVNLSRRSQSLVERQLQLIDRLESSEQDPEQLDNLFQLDHLATRMRRNSDNLLVLAGTESVKRASRPVRLVDVLRASVSEVEQYQRLVLNHPANVLVLGRTASDLVHLLAELLDNATQFSPPDTPVVVTAQLAAEGTVVIEVTDRGVGMTETELARANERLVGTPAVDASVSRRMGLFVVGRLAVRHGIGVWLRGGADGIGVCASVTVPAQLVRPVTENGDTHGSIPTARPLPAGNGLGPEPAALESGATGFFSPQGAQSVGESAAGAPGSGTNGAPPPGAPDRVGPLTDLPRTSGGLPAPSITASAAPAAPTEPLEIEAVPSSSDQAAGSAGSLFRPEPAQGAEPTSAAPAAPAPESSVAPPAPPLPLPPAQASPAQEEPAAPAPTTPAPAAQAPAAQAPAAQAPAAQAPATQAPAAQTPAAPKSAPNPHAEPHGSTPIFDDVASAWFRDPNPEQGQTPGEPTDDEVAPEVLTDSERLPQRVSDAVPTAAADDEASGDQAPDGQAPDGQAAVPYHPAVVEASPPVRDNDEDWGTADDGWRAASALVTVVSAEVTAAGLPRRKPRALLVPGAAGGPEPVEPAASAPLRSAELVRGRLSSYQRGIREGRQARYSRGRDAGESPQQQEAAEETT